MWHSFQRKTFKANTSVYTFRQEPIEYCRSDVTLLRKGVSEFRRLIRLSCQDIDPFQLAFRTASACNYIYRQLFRPKNSIGFLPNNSYRCLDKTCFPACLWLERAERKEKKATVQGETIELFKSGVISNDKTKEGEQKLAAKLTVFWFIKMANQVVKIFTEPMFCSSLVIIMDVRNVIRTD